MALSLRLAALIALGSASGLSLSSATLGLAVSLVAAAAAAAWLAHKRGVRGAATVLLAVATAGAAAARTIQVVGEAEQPALVHWFERETAATREGEAMLRETPVKLRGRLVRDAAPTAFGAQLQVVVSDIEVVGKWRPMSGGLSLSVSGAMIDGLRDWRAGRTIVATASIRRPTRYRNTGLADQARSFAWRGTPLVGSIKSGVLIEIESHGAWWDEVAAAVRAHVRRTLHQRVAPYDEASAAIGTAILIGDRAQLTPALEQRLQQAGTYHVVAISGGNIAILAGVVLALLWVCGIRFAPAAAIAAAVLLAYAWVVGSGASVVRATAMAATYLALRLIDQRTQPVHAAAVAAAGILVVSPLEIAGAGFWLTFGATAALIMTAARWPGSNARWWSPLATMVAASFAVELLLMPISAYVFERVTVAGLVLNLVAIPAMALVQGTASLCVLADLVGASRAAEASGYLTHVSATALIGGSGLVTAMPWATWRVPPPSVAMLAAYYAVMAAYWLVSQPPIDSRARLRAARATGGGVLVLWVWIAVAPLSWAPPRRGGPLRITAVDVGQGDAVLVTAPDGQTLMVDAGGVPAGAFDVGDRVVGPALRARGLRRLDYLAVTHADLDHLGGAAALLRDFRPREVWAGVPVPGHPPLDALRDLAQGTRTPWRWLQRGDRLEVGGVSVIAHHPPLPDWERQRVRNDDSIVLEIRHGAVSVWLTGDITRTVEDVLAASNVEKGRLVVLKAAHHGSLTSSARVWLERLRPAVVLVSAGRGNLFGHPAPAVLQRYRDVGAEVFRTDVDGQIEVVTNGISIEVTTFTGRRWRLR